MRILALYIEPAPYILDLIRVLREQTPGLQLNVMFISASISQPWGEIPESEGVTLLPPSKLAALIHIFSAIRKGGFDWLHLAGWGHPLLLWALLIGALFRRRISMESDTQLPCSQACWKKWTKALIYPRLFALADVLLPGGTRQKTYFQHYGADDGKIRIAQMTVDVVRITKSASATREQKTLIREELGITAGDVVFIYVGRLEPYKGILLLLKTFLQLSEANVRLLIVGEGSCRVAVKDAASIDKRIVYVGRRDFTGVIEAFAIADVAVVPSLFEPWGLVVNEAMAAGLPVIASDRVGAVDDLVVDGITGKVFTAGHIPELLVALKELLDKQVRLRLSAAACELIEEWTLETSAKKIIQAWQQAACDG